MVGQLLSAVLVVIGAHAHDPPDRFGVEAVVDPAHSVGSGCGSQSSISSWLGALPSGPMPVAGLIHRGGRHGNAIVVALERLM
jgi:hypothetical protein